MSFSDVLKSHDGISCIMLHGPVTDGILSSDLCFREFSVALCDILKENGYENIVFYDFTGANGKYVYDDESAYYSISQAREAYEKKYGGPPGGSLNDSGKESSKSQEVKRKPDSAGRRFGKQPKVVRKEIEKAAEKEAAQDVEKAVEEVVILHQQRHLAPELFYGELQRHMMNDQVKSAFVFDFTAFLNDSSIRQYVSQILYQWRNPNNLILFINPDGQQMEKDEAMQQRLKSTVLYEYFYYTNEKGEMNYRQDRCFPIRTVDRDEIYYLLQRMQLFYGVHYLEDAWKIADKINCLLHEEETGEQITLRGLKDRMERYVKAHKGENLSKKFYEEVCQKSSSEMDTSFLEHLCHRAGWEKASQKLVDRLIQLFQELEGETCHETSTEEKIKWMTKKKQEKDFIKEAGGILTMRFGGGEKKRNYPTISQLPHMFVIGRPGTGKTTAARMLGRIFHETGLLATGQVRIVSGGSLQAGYVGQTPMRIHRLLDECENGVLVIDEAYDLCKNFGQEKNAGSFAEEAVNTLVNAMTDDSRHVLLLFLGYPSEDPNDDEELHSVRGLYKMNPGLKRRIKLELEIEDYDADTLTHIFLECLEKKGYALEESLSKEKIRCYMQYFYQTRTRRFGNGEFAAETANQCIACSEKERGDKKICQSDFQDGEKYLEPMTMERVQGELQNYPGLAEIGNRIIMDSVNLYQNRRKNGFTDPGSPRHILLVGKRGTGKTTLAKIICKAWGTAGILSGRPPVVIENPASCRHETIKQEMRRAMEEHTALLIDEAHNIPEPLVQDLLNPMTEYKNLTCIFAVYPERKEEFLSKDFGLRDRCDHYEIPDYTPDQLLKIFQAIARRQHRQADEECLEDLKIWFQRYYDRRESDVHYSNARRVEKIVEELEKRTASPIFRREDLPKELREEIAIGRHQLSFEDILSELDQYIGWEEMKSFLLEMKTYMEYHKINAKLPYQTEHLLFAGNPGTGKTEAGHLFAKACYSLGVTKTDHFCAYGAEDLISGFEGQTRLKTKEALKKGMNGVILIDEAYHLAPRGGHGGAGFEREVIDVLLRFSQEQLGKTIIVLAGYENLLQEFLKSNPGLGGRFSRTIHFPDFTGEECRDILKLQMEKKGLLVEEEALERCVELFKECMLHQENWNNARDVMTICGCIVERHIHRVVHEKGEDVVTVWDVENGILKWRRQRMPV